ncbi:hypothetical protein CVT26_007958 [Gymnopilus dilepis]|uniref:Clathrin/coatomer adaptor adaptin-like N-terminal domain-containing protein n=1 Tax=Gymnopilus dilepis TaxID=231916 RepID=A0A409W7L8_9AGAR|nr:hypothetical protein CVT26_007958 [Gymnopilus dilepis]
MDVPYHSSGAMSRAHYAIVRKVESASSRHAADQDIYLEIQSVQTRLSHFNLRMKECKECLVILLYCALSASPGFLPNDTFDFAFPHAINLAETGKAVEDKRLGYLFCEEMMPWGNELRLMLVNTLRKDLESEHVARICLALDSLISSPNEDVLPAVESRLQDLLLHDYPHVRRRALLALRSLSTCNSALLGRIRDPVVAILQDSDESVVKAALIVAKSFSPDALILEVVNDVLKASPSHWPSKSLLLSLLECLVHVGIRNDNLHKLLDIFVEQSSENAPKSLSKAILLDIFKLFGQLPSKIVMEAERTKSVSIVQGIRQFLVSSEMDDVHFFLACLGSVDAALWAGTEPDYPAALDAFEFERIMQLLSSADPSIRQKTLTIVNRVDPAILDTQLSVLFDMNVSAEERIPWSMRILEILSTRYSGDGQAYATHVIELTRRLDQGGSSQVFKEAIESVLKRVHDSTDPDFLLNSSQCFVGLIADTDTALGPTAFVIATALTTENAANLSVSALALLSGLAGRLQTCPSIVQEPCLIAMMRIRAEVDEVPPEVVKTVEDASRTMRRSIRTRCEQFLHFVRHRVELVNLVRDNPSATLPDFLASLQSYFLDQQGPSRTSPQRSRTSSRASGVSASQLRYDAYDPPEAIPRLRTRQTAPSAQASSSSNSSHQQTQSTTAVASAGALALVESLQDLDIHEDVRQPPTDLTEQPQVERVISSGIDLINLESPHPAATYADDKPSSFYDSQTDFKAIWDTWGEQGSLRGWCDLSMDALIRRVQSIDEYRLRVIPADEDPFKGE